MKVRRGTIEEAHVLISKVPELRQGNDLSHYKYRIEGRDHLILIAEDQDHKTGFKVGFQLSEFVFYSWVGGVLPRFRRSGVAETLLLVQENWVWANQYREIHVKTSNRFPAMRAFLEKNSYVLLEEIAGELVYRKAQPNHGFNRTPVIVAVAEPGETGGGAG